LDRSHFELGRFCCEGGGPNFPSIGYFLAIERYVLAFFGGDAFLLSAISAETQMTESLLLSASFRSIFGDELQTELKANIAKPDRTDKI